MSINLMVFSRPVQGLSVLEALRKLGFKFLRLKRVPVKNFFLSVFVFFGGGLMAPKTANIHFSDPGQKIEDGFSLYDNSFFNILLLSIFSIVILLGLGTDRRPQAVAK